MYRCDHRCALTQTYNDCAETHLSDRVLNAFVFLLSTIARAPNLTVIDSILRKDSVYIFVIDIVH